MNQILHIFKKDARRQWPEVLISLALLALFTRHELHPWQNSSEFRSLSPFLSFLAGRYITPVLVIFWAFLIVRVVQGETLVGDRQWWVTKPYEWWNLLAAKLLFTFVFISVPLFHVQLYLLHESSFPLLPNLWGVVLLQLSTALLVLVLSLLLGSLTRNLAQALVGLGFAIAVLIAFTWLVSKIPSSDMHLYSRASQDLSTGLLIGTLIFVPLGQFARRKTWLSRGILCAGFMVSAFVGVLLPNRKDIENIYPVIAPKEAPVQIAIRPLEEMDSSRRTWSDALTDLNIIIPVSVSNVAPGTVVVVDGINVTTDSAQDSRWNSGWRYQYLQIWPEDQRRDLIYEVNREEYNKIKTKPLHLRVELATSEYREADARTLSLGPGTFYDAYLGTCRINPLERAATQCLKAIQTPGIIARFDAPNFPCAVKKQDTTTNLDVAYAWQPPHHDYLPDPTLNPVVDYHFWFYSVSRNKDADATTQRNPAFVNLCSGAEITLARPEFKRQVRIQLDVPNTRLQDLVETDWR